MSVADISSVITFMGGGFSLFVGRHGPIREERPGYGSPAPDSLFSFPHRLSLLIFRPQLVIGRILIQILGFLNNKVQEVFTGTERVRQIPACFRSKTVKVGGQVDLLVCKTQLPSDIPAVFFNSEIGNE